MHILNVHATAAYFFPAEYELGMIFHFCKPVIHEYLLTIRYFVTICCFWLIYACALDHGCEKANERVAS